MNLYSCTLFSAVFAATSIVIPSCCYAGVEVDLVSSVASIDPGKPFTVALRMQHDPHWHTYWVNAGTGLPTSLTWQLPDGFKAGDIDWPVPNSAMALSNNHQTLYAAVRDAGTSEYGRLVAVNSTTLAPQSFSGVLKDPRNGGASNANLHPFSTSSPMVGPDGRVFFGVVGNPNNGSRGWMLQYSGDLTTQFTPGGFGTNG